MVYFRHMRGGPLTVGRYVSAWRHPGRFCRASQGGFSVIEVLIVLAITGALFVSAAILIAGKQNQTAFGQAMRQVQSQIQQALNDVATGYFPDSNSFRCTAGATPVLSLMASAQGANSGCIFLGKAIQFKVSATDPEQFAVYTVTGLQNVGACATEAACLASAKPMVIAPSNPSHPAGGYPDISVDERLQNGLSVSRVWYRNGAGDIDVGAIVFANSLTQSGASGKLVSGTGRVNIIALDGTTLSNTKLNMAEAMNSDGGNKIANGTINPTGGVFVCFASGGTQDYGIVQIGGEGRDLAITLTLKDNTGAPCTYP